MCVNLIYFLHGLTNALFLFQQELYNHKIMHVLNNIYTLAITLFVKRKKLFICLFVFTLTYIYGNYKMFFFLYTLTITVAVLSMYKHAK